MLCKCSVCSVWRQKQPALVHLMSERPGRSMTTVDSGTGRVPARSAILWSRAANEPPPPEKRESALGWGIRRAADTAPFRAPVARPAGGRGVLHHEVGQFPGP